MEPLDPEAQLKHLPALRQACKRCHGNIGVCQNLDGKQGVDHQGRPIRPLGCNAFTIGGDVKVPAPKKARARTVARQPWEPRKAA